MVCQTEKQIPIRREGVILTDMFNQPKVQLHPSKEFCSQSCVNTEFVLDGEDRLGIHKAILVPMCVKGAMVGFEDSFEAGQQLHNCGDRSIGKFDCFEWKLRKRLRSAMRCLGRWRQPRILGVGRLLNRADTAVVAVAVAVPVLEELDQIVRPSHVLFVDENLRNSRRSVGQGNHVATPLWMLGNVDVGIRNASKRQGALGSSAMGTGIPPENGDSSHAPCRGWACEE